MTQVTAQVIGNDATITIAGMQGHFELNVFMPVMARNLLESIKLLASASRLLDEKCVAGIEANREQCEHYAELTLAAAAALNPYIGYDKASEIVKKALETGQSLRVVARQEVSRTPFWTRCSTTSRWPSRTTSVLSIPRSSDRHQPGRGLGSPVQLPATGRNKERRGVEDADSALVCGGVDGCEPRLRGGAAVPVLASSHTDPDVGTPPHLVVGTAAAFVAPAFGRGAPTCPSSDGSRITCYSPAFISRPTTIRTAATRPPARARRS